MGYELYDKYAGWWCNNHLEKYKSVGKVYPIYSGNKRCSKPPTSLGYELPYGYLT